MFNCPHATLAWQYAISVLYSSQEIPPCPNTGC
jgi:hypothetical protein